MGIITPHFAILGFGEAGHTFSERAPLTRDGSLRVFDLLLADSTTREATLARIDAVGAQPCDTCAAAVSNARTVLSLVTADQALNAAHQAAKALKKGALYLDLNSVAPTTKLAAAQAIESSGGHYIDVAVMAPVLPARLNVPLLVSGPHSSIACEELATFGFTNTRVVGDAVGRASSIKMIRSVVVKGIEALTAECVTAAYHAGVLDEVLASLDASQTAHHWGHRADYNLDRMMVHGTRRAAEMTEVVKTLEDLGITAEMSRATARRQQQIGQLGLRAPADGLHSKLNDITLKLRISK